MIAQSSPKHKQSPKKGTNSVQPFKTAFGAAVLGLGSLGVGMFGTHGVPTPFSPPKRKGHAPAPSHPKTNIPHLLLTPLLSRIFGTTCLDPFRIHRNHWLKFMFGRRRMRRGLFGDAPEAPRVSPKPYARSRTTRPPTVYRPASAIPLTGTCAASEVQRRPSAGCLLCNPRVASTARTARPAAGTSGTNAAEVSPPHRGSGGAGESRGEFFGSDVAGDAPVHLAGPMRKRRPEAPFTSQKPRRRIHRADRRVLRSKMATVVRPKKLGASCSPRRSGGQGAYLPWPCQKIRDKGVTPYSLLLLQAWGLSPRRSHAVSFRFVSCGDSVPLVEAILFRLHGGQ